MWDFEKCMGVTVDGQNPIYSECPPTATTAFKYNWPDPLPNTTCFEPPHAFPPRREAEFFVNPCPVKNFQPLDYPCKYCPCICTRPCCRHYTPSQEPCLYDDPCKAHCFNHPPGMKPSGRYPPPYFKDYLRR